MRAKGITVVLVVLTMAAVGLEGAAVGAEIPWQPAELFQRYSHDGDITDVLRNVLRQNGNDVVFTAGVSGTITYRFERVPLQGVFNMIVGQNDLLYSYDADRDTVYVRAPGDAPPRRKPKRRRQPGRTDGFAAIEHADGKAVIATARRLGLGGTITLDGSGRTAIIKGTRQQVRDIKQLVRRQEATAAKAAAERTARRTAPVPRTKPPPPRVTAPVASAPAPPPAATDVDLSYIYRLSGIGRVGRGARMAILNGKDYRVGDEMDGMEVIEITDDRVRLAKRTESGIESFVVRFRRTAKPVRSPDRPKIAAATRPPMDLTAKYKLSGVGRIGGAHFAVLDGKDYGVGDAWTV